MLSFACARSNTSPVRRKALAEVARVLKPGGMLCITADSMATVISNELRMEHQSMYHVCRYFDVKSLSDAINGAGLHVEIAFPILCSAEAITELEAIYG